MNIETFRNYCLTKKGVSESFPFDESALVMKVLDKMFALTDLDNEFMISLKCDPEKAVELREKYEFVVPARHFNKKHWNTIIINDSISNNFIKEWVNHSYELVISKMTKKQQRILSEL